MRVQTLFFLLALLFATLAHALPGGGESSTPKDAPKLIPNEAATWHCTHKYKVLYSHYKLSGCDWNKTEEEIKRAVENEGIITRWRYAEENNNGHIGFESLFNLPLGRATALGKSTSILLGINKQLKNETSGKKNVGVECPQICKKC